MLICGKFFPNCTPLLFLGVLICANSFLVSSLLIIRRPLPLPRQGRRLGTPEVWNVSFCQGLICGSCQERLGPQPDLKTVRLWPQPVPRQLPGTLPATAIFFYPCPRLLFARNPQKPSAASFAPPGDSGHSHTLGHCQPCVFTRVQDCRLPAVKTLKQLPHSQAPLFKWGSAAPGR